MRRKPALALLALLALLAPARRSGAGEPPPNMESYQLVLLKRGPRWTPERTPETARIQEGHLAHLTRLGEEGKIVLAGPFSDQADPGLRGACIYRVASVEEARALAEADPAVKAGRLAVEAVTWWVEKGYVAFPKAPESTGR
jgi:uncharacterized protein YciI